jgi:CMP-N,N'-diacetyllegionaminic acid synthase
MVVVALIPARAGSKGLEHKNVRRLAGTPLLVHSVRTALACPLVGRVVVTTDSPEYRRVAIAAGAEAPFLRPEALSGDGAPDLGFVQHYLAWMAEREPTVVIDLIVHLRPTSPIRSPGLIADMIARAIALRREDPAVSCMRTVTEYSGRPVTKLYFRRAGERHQMRPAFPTFEGVDRPYDQGRQRCPQPFFSPNGCVDLLFPDSIRATGTISGEFMVPYVMAPGAAVDIDTAADFAAAERVVGHLPEGPGVVEPDAGVGGHVAQDAVLPVDHGVE